MSCKSNKLPAKTDAETAPTEEKDASKQDARPTYKDFHKIELEDKNQSIPRVGFACRSAKDNVGKVYARSGDGFISTTLNATTKLVAAFFAQFGLSTYDASSRDYNCPLDSLLTIVDPDTTITAKELRNTCLKVGDAILAELGNPDCNDDRAAKILTEAYGVGFTVRTFEELKEDDVSNKGKAYTKDHALFFSIATFIPRLAIPIWGWGKDGRGKAKGMPQLLSIVNGVKGDFSAPLVCVGNHYYGALRVNGEGEAKSFSSGISIPSSPEAAVRIAIAALKKAMKDVDEAAAKATPRAKGAPDSPISAHSAASASGASSSGTSPLQPGASSSDNSPVKFGAPSSGNSPMQPGANSAPRPFTSSLSPGSSVSSAATSPGSLAPRVGGAASAVSGSHQ